MDYAPNTPIDVQVLKPTYAMGNNGEDFVAALSAEDSNYMVHPEGGLTIKVGLESFEIQEGKNRTIIIHSKGHYIMNKSYTGKTYRKELAKFVAPGELSRFSQRLYNYELGDVKIIE
jgi:hypothetical protein